MGDAQQHGSFEAFARHIDAATLKAEWNEGKRQLDVAYRSGDDLMEAGFTTDFSQSNIDHFPIDPGAQEKAIPLPAAERRLALPAGRAGARHELGAARHDRTAGEDGAVLATEPGRKAYLIADPPRTWAGAVVGYNPLPDLQAFALTHARRRQLQGRRQGRTAACRIPAVGEGLRHQPCAETRTRTAMPRSPSQSRDLPSRRA